MNLVLFSIEEECFVEAHPNSEAAKIVEKICHSIGKKDIKKVVS